MLSLIIKREYFSRVKRKSFIITTILMPLLMVALMLLPAAIAMFSGTETKTVEVVDHTGYIAGMLQPSEDADFKITDRTVETLKQDENVEAILVIGSNIVKNPSDVKLLTRGAPSMSLEKDITNQLADIIESIRLKEYNIENLSEIMAQVKADVRIDTIRVDGQEDRATSSMLSYITGLGMSFLLYMFILLYGQMVMSSIIEEKSNRVLEIVVSSIDPKSLMMGKILGVGLVALTQILIWALIICSFTLLIMPSMMSGITGGGEAAGMISMLTELTSPSYMLSMFAYLILFMIGGYLFYSSIYAAIGSAVDNVQDASQLQTIAVVPILLGFIVAPTVVQQPDSALAVWTSMIPLTSPMVMMSRIPFGIDFWQIALSLVLLYASFFAMIWVSAKIYRVGIFMYGKKPTLKDLVKWARYK